ncbi:hypothetical protein LTR37_001233 [Vermiconidia calcicola]|uniref:Uncharacterized protein n=1 Tax=Vermiconidia calcicola TaxID=1690605 RepID=A0ACC3NWB4_9PEZI|nr:hypothetical protein LTR37_001233 [Vermiconidia calcicola]
MADTTSLTFTSTPTSGMKRSRVDVDGEGEEFDGWSRFMKKARPTSGDSGTSWPQDSVLNTPTAMASQYTYQKPKYDSDDQSSMMSEPGSPQDISMSTDDDEDSMIDDNTILFSQSPEDTLPSSTASRFKTRSSDSSSPWQTRLQQRANRVPTPIVPPNRPNVRPLQQQQGPRHHIRQRHPQENANIALSSSDGHLDVPSPIDEDEVPTPPSAAEAAGSQLSMLSVNDMEIETEPTPPEHDRLPSISIDTSENLPMPSSGADDVDLMDSSDAAVREPRLIVRKQRQRSDALSSGQGSPSPSPMRCADNGGRNPRGFSMGFRADCEKCLMRVPGHMNHFIG